MAPKTAERVQKELAAQRARAEALRHLQATGSGPSQRELERERQRRAQLASRVSSAVARRVEPAVEARGALDPRVRDNTLQVVARSRADELQRLGRAVESAQEQLPSGWRLATDPVSGDAYFWNEATKETSWERPGSAKTTAAPAKTDEQAEGEDLPADWQAVTDPQSGDKYYWNSVTNETTWTKPANTSVSLQQALEAKSKLDSILQAVDSSAKAQRSNSAAESKSNADTQRQKPVPTQANASAVSGTKRGGNDSASIPSTKRRKAKDAEIDPMDPTGTGGKWSDGLEQN